MLRVEIQSAPEATILRGSGRLVLGVETQALHSLVMSRAERNLVLDLRAVHAMDAAGLGTLVELHCWAKSRGRVLQIANPSAWVRRLIKLANLHAVLQMGAAEILPTAINHNSDETRAMTA